MKVYKRVFKRIKNDIIYLIMRAVIAFFRVLPRKAALTAGSILGRAAPFIVRKEYGLAVKHLTQAFGAEKNDTEIHRLTRETFRNLAMNFVDTARLAKMSSEEVKSVCVPHNIDRVKEKLAQGHGAILVTSHSGCWEMMGAYLTAVGIPLATIARKLYDPRLEKLIFETRKHAGIKVISRGYNTRDMIRSLKEGYLLAFLIDQDTKVKGIFVDFFGQPAYTATAPAIVSRRYNAPIFPFFTYRDEFHRHHIQSCEPIEIRATEDADSDVFEMTVQCSNAIEQFISEHPEQWVWFHRRWKTKKIDI